MLYCKYILSGGIEHYSLLSSDFCGVFVNKADPEDSEVLSLYAIHLSCTTHKGGYTSIGFSEIHMGMNLSTKTVYQ